MTTFQRRIGIAVTAGAIALLATACDGSSDDSDYQDSYPDNSYYPNDSSSTDDSSYPDYSSDSSGSSGYDGGSGGGVDSSLDSDGNGRWNPSPLDPYAN